MNKPWIIDIGEGKRALVFANHRPVGAIVEAPINPYTKAPYPIEFVTVQNGSVIVDYDGLEASKLIDENKADIEAADSLLSPLNEKRKDIVSQSRAFIKYIEGDTSMLNDMSQSIRFMEFAEYERSKRMSDNTYYAIVRSAPGEFEIQEFPLNQRPSNLLAIAPAGFKPGDEEFMTERDGGGFDIDWDGRLAKFNALEKSAEDARKTDQWNSESPLARIKNAFISGD